MIQASQYLADVDPKALLPGLMTVIRAMATLPVVLAMLSPLRLTVLDGIMFLPATVENPLNLSIAIGDLDKDIVFEIYSSTCRLRNFIYNLWYLFCFVLLLYHNISL
jgi:hypothetical protein